MFVKDVRVHAPITWIKLGIPINFIDHSEFITVQCKKILSRANHNEIKCFEFSSIKRAVRPHLRPNYSWINFNISICFPLSENMTILSKQVTVSSKYCIFKIHKNFSMKSGHEKDLKSVNTRSNLYLCMLILIEPVSSQEVLNGTWKLKYTILQNKRMRRCGVAPPPIIFERLKLPQQIIYRRKGNLSESPNHQKYWENILFSRFYEQF